MEECTNNRNVVQLPQELMEKIFALESPSEIEQWQATAHEQLAALCAEEEKRAAAVQSAQADVDAVQEKIAALTEKLHKKEAILARAEEKHLDAETRRIQKQLEIEELKKQRARLDARRIYSAFLASGKSMETLLAFLGVDPAAPVEEAPVFPAELADAAEQTAADALTPEQTPSAAEEPELPAQNEPSKSKRNRAKATLTPELEEGFRALWEQVLAAQGEEFFTSRGLPFRYEVRGKQIFIDRKEKPVSESSLKIAYARIKTEAIDGPKSLKTFGAPYVWGIFGKLGLVRMKKEAAEEADAGMENPQDASQPLQDQQEVQEQA